MITAITFMCLQSQAVLRTTLLLSRSVPARWTWPGSLLCSLMGSLPITAWSFGIPATTSTSPHQPTTSTSRIWGSMHTTASWCKRTHASGPETTAASRSTSPLWRMVRGMGGEKEERGRVCFQLQHDYITPEFKGHLIKSDLPLVFSSSVTSLCFSSY